MTIFDATDVRLAVAKIARNATPVCELYNVGVHAYAKITEHIPHDFSRAVHPDTVRKANELPAHLGKCRPCYEKSRELDGHFWNYAMMIAGISEAEEPQYEGRIKRAFRAARSYFARDQPLSLRFVGDATHP